MGRVADPAAAHRDVIAGPIAGLGVSRRPGGLPPWLRETVVVVLTGLLGFALTAMPLSMLGWFDPIPVTIAFASMWLLLYQAWRSAGPGHDLADERLPPRTHPSERWAAPVVVTLMLVSVAANMWFSSEHVLTERDPAVYVVTAKWLAENGELTIPAGEEPFLDRASDLRPAPAGFYDSLRGDGVWYPQFVHLLPAVLGAMEWLGGSWLLVRGTAILGGIALLMVYVFARRLLRPAFALAVTATLAVNLVQVYFSRDAYTEIPTQIFLFGGLWALWEARRTLSAERGAIAGLLLGATCMLRVDSFVYFVPFVAYLGVELASARSFLVPSARRRFVFSTGLGFVITAGMGVLDGMIFSPFYINDLGGPLRQILLLSFATTLGLLFLNLAWDDLAPIRRIFGRHQHLIAWLGATGILVAAFYAFAVRPLVEQHVGEVGFGIVEAIQLREGYPVDRHRGYAELTMRWLGWYLGPVGLAAGVVGAAFAWRDALLGKTKRLLPFLLIVSSLTAVYVWRPSITPDHIWAMRRFLPQTIPGLMILGTWLAQRLWIHGPDARERLFRGVAVLIVVGSIGGSAYALAPAATVNHQDGMVAAVDELCEALPDDAAVLVTRHELRDLQLTATLRAFCEVPAAGLPHDYPEEFVRSLGSDWRARGRPLVILSAERTPIGMEGLPEAVKVVDTSFELLEQTLMRPPTGRQEERVRLWMRVL